MKVIGGSGFRTVDVAADGTGLSSRAGTALLPLMAGRLRLTGGPVRGTRGHARASLCARAGAGILRLGGDAPAAFGEHLSDLAALAGQPSLFGEVASISTARQVERHLLLAAAPAGRTASLSARLGCWGSSSALPSKGRAARRRRPSGRAQRPGTVGNPNAPRRSAIPSLPCRAANWPTYRMEEAVWLS